MQKFVNERSQGRVVQLKLGNAAISGVRECLEDEAVQLSLGQAAVDSIREFASSEEPTVEELQVELFKNVRDKRLRRTLAETLCGARWLYRLGLVTLASDVHRAAHVRAQMIDYAAICEAVLLDALAHGIFRKQLRGSKWGCVFAKNKWIPAVAWPDQRYEIDLRIRKSRNLYWLIEVAAEEGLVRSRLKRPLHKLRDNRNNVHLAELAAVDEKTGLNMGKEAYRVMHACIECVAHWMTLHP